MLEQFKSLRIRRIDGGYTYAVKQKDNGEWEFNHEWNIYTMTTANFEEELRAGRLEVIDNPLADAINSHFTGKKGVDLNVKFDTSELSVLSDSIVAVAKAGEENRRRIDELHERIEPSSAETTPRNHLTISPTIWQLRRAKSITIRGKIETREHPSKSFSNPMLRGHLKARVDDLLGEQVNIEYFSDAVWQPYAEEQFKARREKLHQCADAAADALDAWNRADREYLEAKRAQEEWYDNLR